MNLNKEVSLLNDLRRIYNIQQKYNADKPDHKDIHSMHKDSCHLNHVTHKMLILT